MTLTAAILVIGNEILSGETQDANIAYIAKRLAAQGIRLREVRIVRDEENAIVFALNALRENHTYVFTTGGIGSTHDDITADSVAAAFGLQNRIDPGTRAKMEAAWGANANAVRLRMARMPEGATPIETAISIAPGFRIQNVFVLAGVPHIMRAQCDAVMATLESGLPVLSHKIHCSLKESDIAEALAAIQNQFPDIDIGSYPHMGETPSLSLVLRGTEKADLAQAARLVAEMVRGFGEEPQVEAA